MVQSLWKTVWHLLKKLNIEFLRDPAIPLLDVYPKELKTGTQAKSCTRTFIAALLTAAKRGKQPTCPSPDKWTNSSNQAMEYYSAIKKE